MLCDLSNYCNLVISRIWPLKNKLIFIYFHTFQNQFIHMIYICVCVCRLLERLYFSLLKIIKNFWSLLLFLCCSFIAVKLSTSFDNIRQYVCVCLFGLNQHTILSWWSLFSSVVHQWVEFSRGQCIGVCWLRQNVSIVQ